jgi:glycyl-tRNA synthetase beta subunit
LDRKTAETLKQMREDETQKHLKKKEDRLKRINKYHEKKKEMDNAQKMFLEEIEKNMQIAESVKSGSFSLPQAQ